MISGKPVDAGIKVPENVITVMIADDHELVRLAVRNLVASQPDLKVVAEADDGEKAVKLAVELVPDVIILDITMPGMNGLEATRIIKRKCPGVKILVLTIHDDYEHIIGIFEAGANGYLTKNVFGEEIITAIRSIVAGDSVLSPQVLLKMLKNLLKYNTSPVILDSNNKLNQRELEILKLLARGLKNKEISQKMNLSLQTVKGYSVSIFSKLGVSSRTEAVMIALRARLLNFDDLE